MSVPSHARLSSFAKTPQSTAEQQQALRLALRYRHEIAAQRDRRPPKEQLFRDLRAFADEDFSVNAYLREHLGAHGHTGRDARGFIARLVLLKEFAEEQMQRKVYLSLATSLHAVTLAKAAEAELQGVEHSLLGLQKLIGQLAQVTFPAPGPAEGAGGAAAPLGSLARPLEPPSDGLVSAVEAAIAERNLPQAVQHFVGLREERGGGAAGAAPDAQLVALEDQLHAAIVAHVQGQRSLYLVDMYLGLLLRIDRREVAPPSTQCLTAPVQCPMNLRKRWSGGGVRNPSQFFAIFRNSCAIPLACPACAPVSAFCWHLFWQERGHLVFGSCARPASHRQTTFCAVAF